MHYILHYKMIAPIRSEEHTSELQSQSNLVCRLLLEKKKQNQTHMHRMRRPQYLQTMGTSPHPRSSILPTQYIRSQAWPMTSVSRLPSSASSYSFSA